MMPASQAPWLVARAKLCQDRETAPHQVLVVARGSQARRSKKGRATINAAVTPEGRNA